MICDVADKMKYFVEMKVTSSIAKKNGCTSSLKPTEILWLGFHAFYVILSRKQTRFFKLVKLLRYHLGSPKYNQVQLSHVVDNYERFMNNILY